MNPRKRRLCVELGTAAKSGTVTIEHEPTMTRTVEPTPVVHHSAPEIQPVTITSVEPSREDGAYWTPMNQEVSCDTIIYDDTVGPTVMRSGYSQLVIEDIPGSVVAEVDYNSMSYSELVTLANSRGLTPGRKKKTKLIEELRQMA